MQTQLTAYTLSEFLEVEYDFRFAIEPILPAGGIALLYGKRNIGKSQLTLTVTEAISAGAELLGTYACTQGPVVIVQTDMSPVEQQDRLRKAASSFSVPENIHILPSPNPLDVSTLAGEKAPDWALRIQEIEPVLVIVDSLRKTHRLEENDSNTPSLVYAIWKQLVGVDPALLFVHHDKKSQIGHRELDPEEAFRGSGAWLDDADTGLHLVRTRDGLKLYFTKLRSCPQQPPILLRMEEDNLLLTRRKETSEEMAKKLLRLSPKMERAQVVVALQAEGFSQAQAYRAADAALEAQNSQKANKR